MINILIVDDSETEIAILKAIFSEQADLRVIGCAHNGKEAFELTKKLNPDLITMDLHMPIMDGIEAIHSIMAQHPTPIIVISSRLNDETLNGTFRALDAGALSVLDKPVNILSPQFSGMRKRIIETVRSMAQIHVVKRRFNTKKHAALSHMLTIDKDKNHAYEIIAIGASVGGPQALKNILTKLPKHFCLPIVIVQHMTPGFIKGFTKWLDEMTVLTVKEAEEDELLRPGIVYFAPDNCHLEVVRRNSFLSAKLVHAPPVAGFCPSATMLLQSVAKNCGKKAIGILLTGMGHDGAQGLLELKHAEGHTIIQDQQSAVVFGMAGVAQTLGAVDKIVELDKIADYLIKITEK